MATVIEFYKRAVLDPEVDRLTGHYEHAGPHGFFTLQSEGTVVFRDRSGKKYEVVDQAHKKHGSKVLVYDTTNGDGGFLFGVTENARDPKDKQPGRVLRTKSGKAVARILPPPLILLDCNSYLSRRYLYGYRRYMLHLGCIYQDSLQPTCESYVPPSALNLLALFLLHHSPYAQ